MVLQIANVLTAAEAAEFRAALEVADWVDGRGSAGYLAARVKDNAQLRYDNPVAQRLGEAILTRLERQPLFLSAALPHRILPPLFNRYTGGQAYGPHIDGAIRPIDGTPIKLRTDLSATLFLTPPEDYDGGTLVIGDPEEPRRVKLRAGDMVLYSAATIHHVEPVTRGVRLAAFFWVQSMIRQDADRSTLFQLDTAIRQMQAREHDPATVVQLVNVYHNLLRRFADV